MDNSQMMMLPQEYSLQLIINEKKEIQLICTAEALEELTVGFLYNEGLIQSTADIVSLRIQKRSRADTGASEAGAVVILCWCTGIRFGRYAAGQSTNFTIPGSGTGVFTFGATELCCKDGSLCREIPTNRRHALYSLV